MEYGEINRPGEDVVLDYAFSGSIVCKTLDILKDGSFYGVVEATSVKTTGTFTGSADCDEFIGGPGARGRGTVFAGRFLVKDSETEYHHVSHRSSSVRDLPLLPQTFDEAIDRGIAAAIASIPSVKAAQKVEQVHEVAEETSTNGGLSARLAALGVEPAFPDDGPETTAASQKTSPPVPTLVAPRSDNEFPQLV